VIVVGFGGVAVNVSSAWQRIRLSGMARLA